MILHRSKMQWVNGGKYDAFKWLFLVNAKAFFKNSYTLFDPYGLWIWHISLCSVIYHPASWYTEA